MTTNLGGNAGAGVLVGSMGYAEGSFQPNSTVAITPSYATGEVIGIKSGNVGRIVGISYPSPHRTITDSFSRGKVSGSSTNVSGFVGFIYEGSPKDDSILAITHCYSSGAVFSNLGPTATSGFVFMRNGKGGGNYFDVQTTGKTSSALATGKTTLEMFQRNTYNWNFDSVWEINEGQNYPCLKKLNCPQ